MYTALFPSNFALEEVDDYIFIFSSRPTVGHFFFFFFRSMVFRPPSNPLRSARAGSRIIRWLSRHLFYFVLVLVLAFAARLDEGGFCLQTVVVALWDKTGFRRTSKRCCPHALFFLCEFFLEMEKLGVRGRAAYAALRGTYSSCRCFY